MAKAQDINATSANRGSTNRTGRGGGGLQRATNLLRHTSSLMNLIAGAGLKVTNGSESSGRRDGA